MTLSNEFKKEFDEKAEEYNLGGKQKLVLKSICLSYIERAREFPQVTRVEVIDHTKSIEDGGGRCYTFWSGYINGIGPHDIPNPKVEIRLQDEGRTLKVFISPKE